MSSGRFVVDKTLDHVKALSPLSLDHIGHQGPRSTRKADQRNAASQLFLRHFDRVHYVLETIGDTLGIEMSYCLVGANGLVEDRSFRFDYLETHPHRLRNDENV